MTEMCCELSEYFISALLILSADWKIADIFVSMITPHNWKHNQHNLLFSDGLVRGPTTKQPRKKIQWKNKSSYLKYWDISQCFVFNNSSLRFHGKNTNSSGNYFKIGIQEPCAFLVIWWLLLTSYICKVIKGLNIKEREREAKVGVLKSSITQPNER